MTAPESDGPKNESSPATNGNDPASPAAAPGKPPPARPTITMGKPGKTDPAALRLGMVLQLSQRARHATREELPFVLVNETRQLFEYRQAAFWEMKRGKPSPTALSGLAVIDKNAPYVLWNGKLASWLTAELSAGKAGVFQGGAARLDFEELEKRPGAPGWMKEWREWLPGQGLAAPLFGPGGWLCGLLCLYRDRPFGENDARLFAHLAGAYGDAYGGRLMRPRRRRLRLGLWRVLAALAVVAAAASLFMPRPQTVLAQAEVAARRPVLIRAEIDGVIAGFRVEPNERVTKGQPLLELDDTQLRTRLAVARKAEEMARVELRQLQQSALRDASSKARLPIAQGRAEQLAAETEYVESLLARVTASSPMDGVALIENPDEWLGRPVNLGQKIMTVADPSDVMLDITLPAGQAMPVSVGDEVLFFPNVSPGSPIRAKVNFVSYRAVETPGLGMAFRLRADFSESGQPMLGLRGIARLSGPEQPLGLILIRKPVMAVRQWLGW